MFLQHRHVQYRYVQIQELFVSYEHSNTKKEGKKMKKKTTHTNTTIGKDDLFAQLETRCLLSAAGEAAGFAAYFPEGFSSSAISEFVPMTNPHDQAVDYSLVAHYETGKRDQVISQGTIAPHSRGGVTISLAGRPELMLVRPNEPYALELVASDSLGATLSHYDFGTAIGESFTTQTSTQWTFGEGYHDHAGTRDFVLMYNPNDQAVDVTTTIFSPGGKTMVLHSTIEAKRRSGWNFDTIAGIPDGVFAVKVEASAPIVASQSHYEISTQRGFGALGTTDGGSLAGWIPTSDLTSGSGNSSNGSGSDNSNNGSNDNNAGFDSDNDGDNDSGSGTDSDHDNGSGHDGSGDNGSHDHNGSGSDSDSDGDNDSGSGTDSDHDNGSGSNDNSSGGSNTSTGSDHPAASYLTVLNTSDHAARVTFTFIFHDSHGLVPREQTITIGAHSRGGLSIADLGFDPASEFGALYRSDVPITVTASVYGSNDATGVSAATQAATVWDFGEGFMSRARAGKAVTEDVYIFNPTSHQAQVTVEFFTSTGQTVQLTQRIDSFSMDDVKVQDLTQILDLGSNVFYGVRVISDTVVASGFQHWDQDLGGGFSTLGIPSGQVVSLLDALAL